MSKMKYWNGSQWIELDAKYADAIKDQDGEITPNDIRNISNEFAIHQADDTKHVTKDGTLQTGLNAEMVGGKYASDIQADARIASTMPLVLEVRTSDPSNPVVGQIWLRSDL